MFRALIDFDILLYEIGFGAETAARGITRDDDALPSWDLTRDMLHSRIDEIMKHTEADCWTGYLTTGDCFRHKIATVKPYKGTRPDKKPFQYQNLKAYMQNHMPHVRTVTGIEADDAMAIDHTETGGKSTIICSRDKDLRQVPGWFFSWELGAQPKFGPVFIEEPGTLEYNKEKKKLSGTGFAFFCAQVMMGDTVDNIPGLPGCGPAKAYAALAPILDMSCDSVDEVKDVLWDEVQDQYHGEYGNIDWMKPLEEQARLCWIVRRMQPVMFNGPSS